MSQSLTGDPQINQARRLIASEYAEQRSQEWLDLRDNMITASDIASAIGDNHYETPDALVKKKVLRTKWAGNAATAHGTLLEPIVRDLYDARFGRKSHEIGLVTHRDYPWLGASPDGVTEDGILIEIKCPLTRKIDSKVPKHYLPQVQLQLEVTDLEECDFVQYRQADGTRPEEFVVTRVTRDREWFAKNFPAMKATWERICGGRQNGLCEIVDEPDEFKNEIVCEIVDDVSAQEQDPDVSRVQEPMLCQVHST